MPQSEALPEPQRRLDELCAPGSTFRKRGEVVCTHTVVSQAHSYQWLGSFGNRGNGLYREELRRRLRAIRVYLQAHQLSLTSALLRLDGQYGMGAVIADLADFSSIPRGKDYTVLGSALRERLCSCKGANSGTVPLAAAFLGTEKGQLC